MTVHITGQSIATKHPEVLSSAVKIGMPHLSLSGLSENWLLKECGHRHWFLLAGAAGTPYPDFRDAAGDPVYAVFRAVAIRDAHFERVAENDDLSFSSSLSRISRTQFVSLHRLTCRGQKVGEIEMISSFVKRTVAGVNRSVARVELNAFPFAGEFAPSVLADVASDFWNDNWRQYCGFQRNKPANDGELVIRPNPSIDFNGAGFLYFASFPALVDRAEWELLSPSPMLTTIAREVIYYGNIEPRDEVVIRVNGLRGDPEADLTHWCVLHRRCDNAKLADIFTRRKLA